MNLGKSPARFDERPDTGISSTISLVLMKQADSKKLFHFKRTREIYACWSKDTKRGIISWSRYWKTLAKAIASEANVPFYSCCWFRIRRDVYWYWCGSNS
jgi:hypothetical protein